MDIKMDIGDTIYSKRVIQNSDKCGCMRCGSIMDSEEIEEWEEKEAVCPSCLSVDVIALSFGGTKIEKMSLLAVSGELKDW